MIVGLLVSVLCRLCLVRLFFLNLIKISVMCLFCFLIKVLVVRVVDNEVKEMLVGLMLDWFKIVLIVLLIFLVRLWCVVRDFVEVMILVLFWISIVFV